MVSLRLPLRQYDGAHRHVMPSSDDGRDLELCTANAEIVKGDGSSYKQLLRMTKHAA